MAKVIHKQLKSLNTYYVIALMSGTSLDGVDIGLFKFQHHERWNFKIIHASTYSYSVSWKKALSFSDSLSATELLQLDTEYSSLLAKLISNFMSEFDIDQNMVDLISSHGHTLFHKPENGYTLQIGNNPTLNSSFNIPVVCDFRVQDVALGGQGAPLVPIGDQILFSEHDACLNLGGFANISFQSETRRLAFDICAVNYVLNFLSNQIGLPFDKDGNSSKKGKPDLQLIQRLDEIEYFKQSGPKSLGAEWVLEKVFPILKASKLPTEDKMASFVEHCSNQIAHVLNQNKLNSVLVTGGGTYNTFLIDRLKSKTQAQVYLPDSTLIEFKEALIFGLMGVLKMRNEINVLSSVTGSSRDHSSGVIYSG